MTQDQEIRLSLLKV